MIKIKFFGQLRELLNCDETTIALPEHSTVRNLLEVLSERAEKWAHHLQADNVLVAVNQEMSSKDQELIEGDEVAFFPPVTGG